jgi:glycosyltransferase involved in cell wall biosynthesis
VATVITRLEGGAGVLALRGALAADPGTCRHTIVTGSGDRLLGAAAAAGIEVVIEPSLRAPVAPRADLMAIRRLETTFRERSFDVVHKHCAKAGVVGRLAARRSGVSRVVHTFHGFPFHGFQSPARRLVYVAVERRLGRITDVALCVRARAALGLPDHATVVGAVGRLTYQKAPEDFLAALQRLGRPGVTGVWIGGGELAGRVSRQASGLTGVNVVLAGERADVLDIIHAFDVFALPSRYEGLPTVVVEAMICGVPVVATAVNAVSDLIISGETGILVLPGRPSRLAAGIRYLLDRPEIASRMAAAARARITGRYGMSQLRDTLIAAYSPDAGQFCMYPRELLWRSPRSQASA